MGRFQVYIYNIKERASAHYSIQLFLLKVIWGSSYCPIGFAHEKDPTIIVGASGNYPFLGTSLFMTLCTEQPHSLDHSGCDSEVGQIMSSKIQTLPFLGGNNSKPKAIP